MGSAGLARSRKFSLTRPGARTLTLATVAFGVLLAAAGVSAFIGLGDSSFDVDELFTLYVVDHTGGLAETLNRALGDTHPPLYYLLLHAWTRLVPLNEATARLPSALFAVTALAFFVIGLRSPFSLTARLFAAALGAISTFYFDQSQNTRDYALALAASAALLVAAARLRKAIAGGGPSAGAVAWLAVAGFIASMSHSYALLQTGMVFAYAILFWARGWRLRAALACAGLAILALNVAYFAWLMGATKEDLHDLWFTNSLDAMRSMLRGGISGSLSTAQAIAAAGLLAVLAVRRIRGHGHPPATRDGDRAGASLARLGGFVIVGVMLSGVAVSYLVAPSLSERNLLTCSPFLWALMARLYDKTVAQWRGRSLVAGVTALVVVMAAGLFVILPGRFLPHREEWRGSARYVAALPGCGDAEIPALQTFVFGPDNTHFRTLAQRSFFGRYLRGGEGVSTWMPAEFGGRASAPALTDLLRSRADDAGQPGACPVLAWGVHDLYEDDAIHLGQDLARLAEIEPRRVVVQEIDSFARARMSWQRLPTAFVVLAAPALREGENSLAGPDTPAAPLAADEARQLGDRIVITLVSSFTAKETPGYAVDTFQLQRWRKGRIVAEVYQAIPRFTCNPHVAASRRKYWPDLTEPGCSNRRVQPWSRHSQI